MSVYVDGLLVFGGDDAPPCFRHKPSCHMYADSLEELHRLAILIGMRREWFQNHPWLPHYDLTPRKRAAAVRAGALETDRQHMAEHSAARRAAWRAVRQPVILDSTSSPGYNIPVPVLAVDFEKEKLTMAATSPAPAGNVVSFKLGDFSVGSAGFPEGIWWVKKNTVEYSDYGGKIQGQTIALIVTAQELDLQTLKPKGNDIAGIYSLGDPSSFGPGPNGTTIMALGSRTQLGRDSKGFIWLENLVSSGFPEDKFDNDFSVFDDMVVKIAHIPDKERAGLPTSNLVAGAQTRTSNQPRTVAVAGDILKLPWDKTIRRPGQAGPAATKAVPAARAAAAAPARAAAPAPAPAAVAAATNGESDPSAILVEHLTAYINGVPEVVRTQARVGVYKSMQAAKVDTATRDAALQLFNSDESLGNVLGLVGSGYVIDGANIKSLAG